MNKHQHNFSDFDFGTCHTVSMAIVLILVLSESRSHQCGAHSAGRFVETSGEQSRVMRWCLRSGTSYEQEGQPTQKVPCVSETKARTA